MTKKLMHFDVDPYYLLNFITLRYQETHENEQNPAENCAMYEILTDPEFMLSEKEWNLLVKAFKHDHNDTSDQFVIDDSNEQPKYFWESIKKSKLYKKRYIRHSLMLPEPKNLVYDKSTETIYECSMGEHYETIIKAINTDHKQDFVKLSQEEKDQFILDNFILKGNNQDMKWYSDSISKKFH